MFWFFKLGLLTSLFNFGLTIALDATLLLLARLSPVGLRVDGTGLTLGAKYGVVFGILWLISFSAAWWIVYLDLKSRLATLPN